MAKRFILPATPALEAMLQRDAELGFEPLEHPPRPPAPPVVVPPLVRPAIPPVDWQEEIRQREREERERREHEEREQQ